MAKEYEYVIPKLHDRSKYPITYTKGEKRSLIDRGDVLILRTNKPHKDLAERPDVFQTKGSTNKNIKIS